MKWLSSLRRETSDDPGAAEGMAADLSSVSVAPVGAAVPTPAPPPAPTDTDFELPSETATAAAPDRVDPASPAVVPSAPLESLRPLFDALSGQQSQLADAQRSLHELFNTRLRSDDAQALAVEKLHDELRQYKTNFVRQQLLPLLKEVIFCHDFVTEQIERLSKLDGEVTDGAAADSGAVRALQTTRQMLVDLLFKYDVEPFRSEGEQFDPKSQQCMRTIPTDRAEADKTIAARGAEGFRAPEGIVRREQVSVYKFTPGAD